MSGTDKDMPVWASAEYYEPWHAYRCGSRPGTRFGDEPCTLPAEPVRQHPAHRRTSRGACIWEPVWPGPAERRYRCTWGPKRDDRHFGWWGPDRAKVRDQMTKARQQYNASREVEIVERVDQHRHAPVAGWWD